MVVDSKTSSLSFLNLSHGKFQLEEIPELPFTKKDTSFASFVQQLDKFGNTPSETGNKTYISKNTSSLTILASATVAARNWDKIIFPESHPLVLCIARIT
jgi:hypothetical protein